MFNLVIDEDQVKFIEARGGNSWLSPVLTR